MRLVLVALTLAFAVHADPPYPTEEVKGYFVNGFDKFETFGLIPGTLSACVDSPSGTYTFYTCDLKATEMYVEVGGVKRVITFNKLSASENAGTPSYPATLSYYFSGKYTSTLPDGKPFETQVTVSLARTATDPDKLEGQLNMYTVGVNGGIIARLPSP